MIDPTPPIIVPREPAHRRAAASLLALFDRRPVQGATTRYDLIDLLRGIAALCVLFRHYVHFSYAPGPAGPLNPMPDFQAAQPFYAALWPLYDYGQYAVQIFWMISGFVFAGTYAARKSTTRSFVVNRFARLYPLHLLTLLAVAGLQALSLARRGGWWLYQDNTWPYFVLHLFFASNWSRRFPASFNGPVWSVSVEVLVYAAFWAALPFLFFRGVVGPLLMSLLFSLLNVARLNDLIGSCGIYFFGGATLYVMHDRWRGDRAVQLFVAVGMICAGCLGIAAHARTLGCVSMAGGGLILAMAAAEGTTLSRGVRPLRWIGESTYGVYLLHLPIQLGLVLAMPVFGLSRSAALSPWFLLLFLALVLAAGRCSYVFFETPMQRWLRAMASGSDAGRRAAREPTIAGP